MACPTTTCATCRFSEPFRSPGDRPGELVRCLRYPPRFRPLVSDDGAAAEGWGYYEQPDDIVSTGWCGEHQPKEGAIVPVTGGWFLVLLAFAWLGGIFAFIWCLRFASDLGRWLAQ